MYEYRITKYNPQFRNPDNGAYLLDEWTSISDIGRKFNGEFLTAEEYIKKENSYVQTISLVLNYKKISKLFLEPMNKFLTPEEFIKLQNANPGFYSKNIIDVYENVEKYKKIKITESLIICRLMLREQIDWSSLNYYFLYYPRKFKLRIGYDYYMYVACSTRLNSLISEIESLGLFVEEWDAKNGWRVND